MRSAVWQRGSSGLVGSDGKYTLEKGVPPGKYVVNLTAMDPYPQTDKLGGRYAPGQSKLVVEVGKGDVIIDVGK